MKKTKWRNTFEETPWGKEKKQHSSTFFKERLSPLVEEQATSKIEKRNYSDKYVP